MSENIEISYPRLKTILESLLFITKRPVTPEELAHVIGVDASLVEKSLYELLVEYEGKGVNIVKIAGGYQMVTKPDNASFVDRLIHSPIETTLSGAALETLAIIAYKQPVTRLTVENIRGVNSDGVIQTLLDKRLIEEAGRSEGLGRPILYSTTVEFLRHFGLKDLRDLSPLPTDEASAFREGSILPREQE